MRREISLRRLRSVPETWTSMPMSIAQVVVVGRFCRWGTAVGVGLELVADVDDVDDDL